MSIDTPTQEPPPISEPAPPRRPRVLDDPPVPADAAVERFMAKLKRACDIHGPTDISRALGVSVDTIYTWLRGEHRPRDLSITAVLDLWADAEKTTALRYLAATARECSNAKQTDSREVALHASAVMFALALKEIGVSYDFEIKGTRRPRLRVYVKYLQPLVAYLHLHKGGGAYLRMAAPEGGLWEIDCTVNGYAEFIRKLRVAQSRAYEKAHRLPTVEELDRLMWAAVENPKG